MSTMAYQKGYALSVKCNNEFLREKNQNGERQVFIPFGSEYSLYLKNKTDCKAKFQVYIDGKLIAPKKEAFVIEPFSSFELERFMLDGDNNKGERFRFVNVEESGEEPNLAENGEIKVVIKKEKKKKITLKTKKWTRGTNTSPISPPMYRSIDGTRHSMQPNMSTNNNFSFTSNNSTYSANLGNVTLDSMNFLADTQEEGVTVGGSESYQQFINVPDFETETTPIILTLKLKPTKQNNIIGSCPGCNGDRVQTNFSGVKVICPVCNGTGVFKEEVYV